MKKGRQIRKTNWLRQQEAGIDLIPSNDFSLYDQMLDTSAMLGALPERFGWSGGPVDWGIYFAMAHGNADRPNATPMEMTKWFDTNYHSLVPELDEERTFRWSATKVIDEFQEAKDLGILTKPVLIGPVTFLALGKSVSHQPDFNRLHVLDALLPVYEQILRKLEDLGANWIQMDEPILANELTEPWLQAILRSY